MLRRTGRRASSTATTTSTSLLPSWGAGYKRELDIDTVSVGIAYKF